MTEARDTHVFLAKLAEQAERYEDMVKHMKDTIALGPQLSTEERNLLSVAYKNAIGARRASWRIVLSTEQKQESKGAEVFSNAAKSYRATIEEEMSGICNDILKLLDEQLIANAATEESKVFYNKMKGDYHRYSAEFTTGDKREEATKKALEAYNAAYDIAKKEMPPTHPIRLGLALNFSVFHYEILNDHKSACDMAQEAFDTAIAELDNVTEDAYRDSTLIMQLLRDNLTLWSNEEKEEPAQPTDA